MRARLSGAGDDLQGPERPREAQTRLKAFSSANVCHLQNGGWKGNWRKGEGQSRVFHFLPRDRSRQARRASPLLLSQTRLLAQTMAQPLLPDARSGPGGAASPSPSDLPGAGAAKVPTPRSLLQPALTPTSHHGLHTGRNPANAERRVLRSGQE